MPSVMLPLAIMLWLLQRSIRQRVHRDIVNSRSRITRFR
jgi:hypothetical protein